MIDFIEDLKEHCQKNPEVRVNSEKLLQFVESYEFLQEKLSEIEKQEPVGELTGVFGFSGRSYFDVTCFDALPTVGAKLYASPVQQSPVVGNEWHPIENAPKNKAILLDIGFPWPVFGIFNAMNNEFAYADMHAENFKNYTDIYFQTDYEKNPVAWMPLPELAKKLQNNNNDCSPTTQGVSNAQE